MSNSQNLCISLISPYEPKQEKIFMPRRLLCPAVLREYASLSLLSEHRLTSAKNIPQIFFGTYQKAPCVCFFHRAHDKALSVIFFLSAVNNGSGQAGTYGKHSRHPKGNIAVVAGFWRSGIAGLVTA